jgi:hypothetical protein
VSAKNKSDGACNSLLPRFYPCRARRLHRDRYISYDEEEGRAFFQGPSTLPSAAAAAAAAAAAGQLLHIPT